MVRFPSLESDGSRARFSRVIMGVPFADCDGFAVAAVGHHKQQPFVDASVENATVGGRER